MRQVYRIDLSSSYYLRGILRATGNHEVEGKLVDISSLGASMVFHAEVDPKLSVGHEVGLSFRIAGNSAELRTTATVRTISKPDGFVRYGFQFGDFENWSEIPYVLRAVFNRRRAPRVTPSEPVSVRVSGAKSAVEGKLVDLSVCGVSVEMPFHMATAFEGGASVELSFTLPGGVLPVGIKGSVRDRRLVGPTMHLGIEFDAEASPDSEQNLGRIEDYVSSRELSPDYVPG